MPENLIIRKAHPSDITELVSLLQILFSIEADFTPDPEKQRRGLELMFADAERRCLIVAEKDGKIAGMGSAQLVVSTAEGALSGLVEDMVLYPEYRGRGIGRKILTALERWCYQQGATRIQLLADRENEPALRFYAKLGWEKTQLICLRKLK